MTAFFMMKKIALIYMGGTFGCVGEALSPMPAAEFIPQLQHVLPLHVHVDCFVAPVIRDSSACTAPDWLLLIQQIQSLQLQHYQHFVIIHGTDTLSYASAVLARFIAQSAHVILTGSQYPLLNVHGTDTREFTDAISNLNFALDQVLQVETGVYLAFHHKLIHASTALKTHTTELDAFSGQLSGLAVNTVPTNALIVQTAHIEKARAFNCISLMLQPVGVAQLEYNLKALSAQPPHVLILQGFGTGNIAVNDQVVAQIKYIQQQGCAVILTTQVPFGAIDQRYAVSQWVQDAQILVSNCAGHADLYAKVLQMYLQYDAIEQWHAHW